MTLNIRTAVEIGVYRGGCSYFLCAVMQRVRPDFSLTMIDPWDSLLGFDQFSRKLNLIKAIPASSGDFKGKRFDFAFIDGDHTYEVAMRDYVNLGRHAIKATAIHDNHDHSPDVGTIRAWDDMKNDCCQFHEIHEFAHSVPRGLRIGLIVNPEYAAPALHAGIKEAGPGPSIATTVKKLARWVNGQ